MSKWSEFYARHGERNFTPTFNTYLDALIADTSAEIPERVDAWIIRRSWGNHADQCENGKGVQLVQADCARELDVPRQAVNPVFKNRQRRGYIRILGRGIYPVDEPEEVLSGSASFSFSSPNVETFPTNSEEEANKPEDDANSPLTFEEFITTVWAAQHPKEYRTYREIERQYKEFRMRLLNEWRTFLEMSERSMTNDNPPQESDVGEVYDNLSERSMTNGAPSYKETIKPSTNGSSSSFSGTGQPQMTTTTSTQGSLPQIAKTLWEYAGISDEALIRQLRQNCRAKASDCTDEEIAHFITLKGHLARGKPSPGGYLLTTIANCFEGHSFQQFRAERSRQQAAEEQRQREDEERRKRDAAEWEREVEKMQAQLADPDYPENEKRFIRKILGIEEPEGKGPASEPGAQAQKAAQA